MPTTSIQHAISSFPSMPLRLSKLEREEFNGDPLHWHGFWDAFKTAVQDQPIPDIQKLNYLLTYLRGRAYTIVAGYSIIERNYRIIVDVRQRRFGRPEVFRHSLHMKLKKFRACSTGRRSQTTARKY